MKHYRRSRSHCEFSIAQAEMGDSWIPGLAMLARNDGRGVFGIPAQPVPSPYWGAGIQGVWCRISILFLSSEAKNLAGAGPRMRFFGLRPQNDSLFKLGAMAS